MRLAFLFSITMIFAASAMAQEVRSSSVSGILVSRSATVVAGDTISELFVVPQRDAFVLTQACVSQPIFYRLPYPTSSLVPNVVVGSVLGAVPLAQGCTEFEPGVAFVPGEVITCERSSAASTDTICFITGVLQHRSPHGGQ
jgi:hypothetical protein